MTDYDPAANAKGSYDVAIEAMREKLLRSLPAWKRHRMRKRGEDVPFLSRKKGYKQTPEHIEKRKRSGEKSHHWTGDQVSERGGRARALRLYKNIGPCVRCGAVKAERHHKDGNTANNAVENIEALCRRCHMEIDGRMESCRGWATCEKK